VLGIDLGSRRIGLACSDRSGTIATPLRVLERSGDRGRDHRAIVDIAIDEEAERIVVGWPLSLSGDEGPAARAARLEADELQVVAGEVPVELHDERLTTVSAERSLLEAGLRRDARTKVRDAVAAAVMLQAYLEGPR
jgi:putative Holliday junction resolvase